MYVPLDVNFPDDERVEVLSAAAKATYVDALCFAKRMQSDGTVTTIKLRRYGATTECITELIRSGLVSGDPDGSIRIEGWLKHNPSAEQLARPGWLNHKRWHVDRGIVKDDCEHCKSPGHSGYVRPEAGSDSGPDQDVDPSGLVSVEEREEEREDEGEEKENTRASADAQALAIPVPDASPSATVSESWERFWSAYPKKVGKQAARKAWDRARKRRPADEIQAALDAHLPAWSTIDVQFVPNPATWLGQGRYEDPPPKPRSGPAKPNRVDENMAKIQRSMQRMAAS